MAKKKKNKWLDLSAFDDGYDKGDIKKTIVNSAKRTSNTIGKAVGKSVSKSAASDTFDFLSSRLDSSRGNNVARNIITGTTGLGLLSDFFDDKLGNTMDSPFSVDEKEKEEEEKKEEERTYFKKGLFEDGYDFGDIGKTIYGTATDIGENIGKGLGGIGEGLIDTVAYGAGGVSKLLGNDKFADKTKDFISRDLVDEYKIGEKYGSFMFGAGLPGLGNKILNRGEAEPASALGEKTDSITESGGQLLGTMGLQAVGVPWFVTTGVTAFGSGTEEAFKEDATYGEAGVYGGISAASEMIFEKLGGIKFGGKALDTGLKKELSKAITNKTARALTKFGIDVGTEGTEEVLTEITQNIGKKLTYEDEKTWQELLVSEGAMDSYLEAFIGGAVMGGAFNAGKVVGTHKTGRDYDTGLTDNEQTVINAEVENRAAEKMKKAAVDTEINNIIAEQEKTFGTLSDAEKKNIRAQVQEKLDNGELDYTTATLSKKERAEIEQQVEEDLRKGYIGIDTIESTLAGEKTSRLKELEQQLSKTTNEQEKHALEAELNQLKGAKAEELKNLLSKDSFLQESYRQEALKGQEFAREATEEDSEITKELIESAKASKMNNTRKMHDLFEYTNKIANDAKTKYGFVNNEQLKQLGHDVEGKTVNGLVRVNEDGTSKVLINVDSDKSLNTIIGHETTHLLEGSEEYKALQNIVKEYATTKGEYNERYKQISSLYQGTNANVENEITADLVGDYLFTDEQFINNLSTKEPNIFQKVYDYIKHVYKMATAGSAEARQLEEVKRKFDKAYKQISKTTTQVVGDNSLTGADSNTKYHVSDTFSGEIDKVLNNEVKSSNQVKARDYTPEILVKNGVSNLPMLITQRHVKSVVYNEAEAKELGLPTNKGIHYHGLGKDLLIKSIDNMDNPSEIYKQDNDHYLIITEIKNDAGDNIIIPVKIDGKGAYNDVYIDENQIQSVYGKKNLEKYLERNNFEKVYTKKGTALNEGIQSPNISNSFEYNISENGNNVNRELTKEQQEYFKDSKVRDEEGNLKVMYHGTSSGGHTVFDPYGKARYGLFGAGSYFTDNKSVAESYTEKGKGNNKQVYETYLNITNPIDMDAQANREAWTKALPDANFPEAGTNEDFYRVMEEYFEDQEYARWEAAEAAMEIMEDMGYDGITHIGGGRFNKKDETRHQVYIAFHSEQIKSIDNEKPTTDADIRHSVSDPNQDIAPTGRYNVYGSDVKMPVKETAPAEEIAPVAETTETVEETVDTVDMGSPLTEDDLPYFEQQRDEAFYNITEDMAPIEQEPVTPPYEGEIPVEVKSPLEDRDIQEVGKRDVKAYMYENPEVKPFFQDEAAIMLTDLNNSVRGKKYFNDELYYITGGEEGFWGTTRQTTADIAELLDKHNYKYADIEKGLKAIIEDNGKENNAISKRIEFFLDERLREGYTSYDGLEIPPNEEYVEFLREKQIVEYDDIHYDEWLRSLAEGEDLALEADIASLEAFERAEAEAKAKAEEEARAAAETEARLRAEAEAKAAEEAKAQEEVQEEPEDIVAKTRKELRKELLADKSDFLTFTLDNANNKAMALLNNTDTIRVQELVFGRSAGKKINETIFQPAIDNEAKSIRWQNKQRAEIKALGIKPRSKMSAAVQKYGEKQYVDEFGDIVPYGEAELKQEFKNEEDRIKIRRAADVLRNKYDQYIDEINKVFAQSGFAPIPKRDDYMRHFQVLNDVFSTYGIPFNPQSMQEHTLPTDINGLTEFWSPQKNYFANLQPRKGIRTEYDAITGIDGYIGGAANLIFHTKDIQRGRAFEEMIRNRYGQEKAEETLANEPEENRQALLQKIQDNHNSNYAAWLHEWTNNLAGKKNKVDRSIESMLGRRAFSFLDTVRKQVGANMIGLNISSSLTNLIAPVQAMSKTSKIAVAKGTADTVKNIWKKDGFVDRNLFLTSRFGTDMLSKNAWQKTQDAVYIFMKGIDHFSSNLIVRSKYHELISKGMSDSEAHAQAGQFAARIMGDRTKGANAQLYNSKLIGMVTQFQLEVNNQLYSMFYDTYHESKEKAKGNAAKTAAGMTFTLGQLFALTHVFGQTFEGLAGYNPTFDVVDIVKTLFGIGDDEEEKKPFGERVEAATLQLLKSLPYTSTFTGGRIPIGQAFPIEQLVTGKDEYGNDISRPETLAGALPYYVLPGGYSQIKKTWQGLKMFDQDNPVPGSYTDSGNLRFPVEDTFGNRVKSAVFGQWSSDEARDYINNERAPLKERQIEEYKNLDIPIAEYWDIREGLADQDTLEDKFNYIVDLDLPVSKKNILINNAVDRDEDIDLSDAADFSSFAEFDFATKYPEKYAFAKAVGGYESYDRFTDDLWDIKADKDSNGNSIRGTRKTKVIDYINGLPIDYEERLILFKKEYPSDDLHNQEIIDYLNNREDISYDEMVYILEELDFTVTDDGMIYW